MMRTNSGLLLFLLLSLCSAPAGAQAPASRTLGDAPQQTGPAGRPPPPARPGAVDAAPDQDRTGSVIRPPDAAAPGPEAPPPPAGSIADAIAGRDLYHGNFCGAGSRLGALEPIDELDAACKRHDECYERNARRACGCDRQLKRDAFAIAESPRFSREIRARAGTIMQAAELMACDGD
jgi:hypothetical protein